MDPGIICFKHCKSKIFCFCLPETCPDCLCLLENEQFSLLPFRIPYPFIRAQQNPCSVVIKPTNGSFINDYSNSMDLHIGLTTSDRLIVEFDENGLRKHKSVEWDECLLLEKVDQPWFDHWDQTLLEICKSSCWTSEEYNEDKNNCYSFVLSFLKQLQYGDLSVDSANKTSFCEKYIIPKTSKVGKYISLYRKLKETNGIYSQEL